MIWSWFDQRQQNMRHGNATRDDLARRWGIEIETAAMKEHYVLQHRWVFGMLCIRSIDVPHQTPTAEIQPTWDQEWKILLGHVFCIHKICEW